METLEPERAILGCEGLQLPLMADAGNDIRAKRGNYYSDVAHNVFGITYARLCVETMGQRYGGK